MNNKGNQYYQYIDTMKGFAMLLVVMGHVIAWTFADWHIINTYNGPSPSYLWHFIYKFHMPLFIFISGILFYNSRKIYTWKYFFQNLFNKFKCLLIPYFIVGPLLELSRNIGEWFDYWYLLVLFQCILINSLWEVIRPQFKYSIITDILFYLVIYNLISYGFKNASENIQYIFRLDFMRYYLYFSLGILCHRYKWINTIKRSNLLYTFSLAYYIIFFFGRELGIVPPSYNLLLIARASMCFVCVYLFYNIFNTGRIVNYLQLIGKQSLQIYLIHFFFTFNVPWIGEFSCKLVDMGKIEILTNMGFQLVYSLIISSIVICICLLISRIIGESRILSPILLGRKSKSQNPLL